MKGLKVPGTFSGFNVGTVMASTSYNRTSCQDRLYYPYGEFWTGAGNCGMHQTFASLPDYDVETDQYNTANRHYSPMGHWMSPDPGNAGADPSDPQTWNMYAYVTNNPTTLTDPTGEYHCDPDTSTSTESGGVTTVTVKGGACHLDWWDLYSAPSPTTLSGPDTSPLGQEAPVMPTPAPNLLKWGTCVADFGIGGAVLGGIGGALLGGTAATAGGPELTIPEGAVGAKEGTVGGAAAGAALGGILCSQGSGGGGGGGRGGGNVQQNRQARDARNEAARETGKKWTEPLEEKFHNEITKQGITDYHELVQIAKDVLNGYR